MSLNNLPLDDEIADGVAGNGGGENDAEAEQLITEIEMLTSRALMVTKGFCNTLTNAFITLTL